MRAIVRYFNRDKVSPQEIKYKNKETKFMAYSTIDFGLKHNEIISWPSTVILFIFPHTDVFCVHTYVRLYVLFVSVCTYIV
jgi:hypothetical protein